MIVGAGAAGFAAACTVAFEGDGAEALLCEKGETRSGLSPVALGTAVYTNDEEAMCPPSSSPAPWSSGTSAATTASVGYENNS